ncbi:protein CHLOROPLAST IMPORT APPARATUS 2-like [Tasmannia lanceolata]|uniref:protein CHLOROPLAST IMPORT APPARATUS 2-like n=1 Tax=Tasmannia lanceolata TaxID=3420 RepID=UPI0040633D2B
MSSCLTGGRTYGFDLEIIKSPSSSSRSFHSSSPSSTLSESSNSALAISTRKPRTPRKRPNQTYTEAAALLSTIYPNIFSPKNLRKLCKHTKSHNSFSESPELLPTFPAFDNTGFLLHQPIPEKPTFRIEPKLSNYKDKTYLSFAGKEFQPPSQCNWYEEDDFDVESILDGEIEHGIDSIMGNLSVNNDSYNGQTNACYGNPMGMGFGENFEFGFRLGANVRALRHRDDGDWWRFPTVEVMDIFPKFKNSTSEKKKKKKKKVEGDELKQFGSYEKNPMSSLCLKLNYEEVLNAWSDRGSLYIDEIPTIDSPDYVRSNLRLQKLKRKNQSRKN